MVNGTLLKRGVMFKTSIVWSSV